MARIVPQYRARLMFELFRQIRKAKVSGPVYVSLVDRLMFLDRLAPDIQLNPPKERPGKIPAPEVIEAPDPAELEMKRLLDEHNRATYGGESERTNPPAS